MLRCMWRSLLPSCTAFSTMSLSFNDWLRCAASSHSVLFLRDSKVEPRPPQIAARGFSVLTSLEIAFIAEIAEGRLNGAFEISVKRRASAVTWKVTMKVTQDFNVPHPIGLNRASASLAFLWKSVRRLGLSILFCLVNFSGAANLAAQTAATAPAQPSPSPRAEETAPPTVEEAALVLQNRTITVFRSRFQGRSPCGDDSRQDALC